MKSKTKIMPIFVILAASLLLVSSGSPDINRDGTKKTGNETGTPEIKLEFVGHLGEIDGEDENYLFYKPCDIAGDLEGNLYVLDAGNHRIQKYDKMRKYLNTFGRSGQGPGEFQRPLSIDLDKDGHIYVADWANCRLEVFSSDGKFLRSVKLKTPVHRIRILNSGEIAIMNPSVGRANSKYEDIGDGSKPFLPLIKIIDEKFNVLRRFGEGKLFKIFPLINGGNRLTFTADEDDNIYLALLFQNSIEKYTAEGKCVFKTDRPVPDEMHHRTAKKPNVYILISQGIDVDSSGRIWLITCAKRASRADLTPEGKAKTETDRYRLDVFDEDGTFLKSFPLNHFCADLRIIDDTIYILDKERTMRFYVYKI